MKAEQTLNQTPGEQLLAPLLNKISKHSYPNQAGQLEAVLGILLDSVIAAGEAMESGHAELAHKTLQTALQRVPS